MFQTLKRAVFPNPFKRALCLLKKRGGKKILLFWNRGLGDLPLGLSAMIYQIRQEIPKAEITFLTREELIEGFSLLEGIQVRVHPGLIRGERLDSWMLYEPEYDLIFEWPDPTYWVDWQIGTFIPKLKWDLAWDALHRSFDIPEKSIGVQVLAESQHGPWRNWPYERWSDLFSFCKSQGRSVLLLGFPSSLSFPHENLIDLRGKTSLRELLSIIKNRCSDLVLPDSGILSIIYYLNVNFPIRVVSLWADVQGVLKQNVASPNTLLEHFPLFGKKKDLSSLTSDAAIKILSEHRNG